MTTVPVDGTRYMSDDSQKKLSSLLGSYWIDKNSVDVLKDGDEIFKTMLSSIENSHTSIDLLTYVYWKGKIANQFAEALIKKANEGVRVRLLLDAFGARLISRKVIKALKKSSVELRWFRRLTPRNLLRFNHRTHRKILICDKKVAYTGGVGIAQEWKKSTKDAKEWKDTHFKIRGPILRFLQSAFLQNWYEEKTEAINLEQEQILMDEDSGNNVRILGVDSQPNLGMSKYYVLLQSLLQIPLKCLYITSAYFVPSYNMIKLIEDLVCKGVDVRILVPGNDSDSRLSRFAGEYFFDRLLKAGIKIYTFKNRMLHSKVFIVDDFISCIGSGNFNQRSLNKDDEISLVVHDTQITKTLIDMFHDNLKESQEVTMETRAQVSLFKKLMEFITYHLLSKNL